MRPGRPSSLRDLERDHLHQLTGSGSENRAAARRTLREARAFQQLAQVGIESGLALPAVSNFHEAARLAVTAVATANGFRLRRSRRRRVGEASWSVSQMYQSGLHRPVMVDPTNLTPSGHHPSETMTNRRNSV